METGNNILLVGPTGSGKTKVIQDLLKNTGFFIFSVSFWIFLYFL